LPSGFFNFLIVPWDILCSLSQLNSGSLWGIIFDPSLSGVLCVCV
jgi:hypothetical protein